MPQRTNDGPDGERRSLWAGLSSMAGNPFWQWLRGRMEERQAYLQQRLQKSADWSEFRFTCGQLEALSQLLRQIEEIENTMQRRDEDDVL